MRVEWIKFLIVFCILSAPYVNNLSTNLASGFAASDKALHLGVNMRGYFTSMAQSRIPIKIFPTHYYVDSFKILSKAGVIDHVRFRFYWESYVKNPVEFMKEIEKVANTADKFGLKVIYDNHQFHTSSWLDNDDGTGFPAFLFNDTTLYPQDSSGTPKSTSAKIWWTNWWINAFNINGTDGWTLQADYLKKIVSTVDKHPSTLGYEILSEPQVHSKDEWTKIGKYNTFMTNELRKITDKTIIYSMNIPIDLKSPIDVNSVNLAKMTPTNKKNVVFKFSLYGVPSGGYQEKKLELFLNVSKIAGVPLYVGEWNNVKRVATIDTQGKKIFDISESASDITQSDANTIVEKFRQLGIWGLAYWGWSFVPEKIPNFNLITVKFDNSTGERNIITTKYFDIMKNAYESVTEIPTERVFPTS
jgi:hypothetical protein